MFIASVVGGTVAALDVVVDRSACRSGTGSERVANLSHCPWTRGRLDHEGADAVIEGQIAVALVAHGVAIGPSRSGVSTRHVEPANDVRMKVGVSPRVWRAAVDPARVLRSAAVERTRVLRLAGVGRCARVLRFAGVGRSGRVLSVWRGPGVGGEGFIAASCGSEGERENDDSNVPHDARTQA